MRSYRLWMEIEFRAITLGNYIVENNSTVRSCARAFGISKSTVHKDVTESLKDINPLLYKEVREVLEYNKSVRHIRGGLATKRKYSLIELSKLRDAESYC